MLEVAILEFLYLSIAREDNIFAGSYSQLEELGILDRVGSTAQIIE